MMEIQVKIEISNVENWSIDWNDESVKKEELKRLDMDLKTLIVDHIGIYFDNIKVNSSINPER